MSLEQDIHAADMLMRVHAQHNGEPETAPLRIAPDETMYDIWHRACRNGSFRLRNLYVLRRPLSWDIGGVYEFSTGDVAVVCREEGSREDGYRSLFHELAHAQRLRREDLSIAAWQTDETATEQAAHRLAADWGYAYLFPDDICQERLEDIEERAARWHEIALLVGVDNAGIVGSADRIISEIAHQHGWPEDERWDAILGCADDPERNQVVLLFDRTELLRGFSLDRLGETGLGDLALQADDEMEQSLLHNALARCVQAVPQPWQHVRQSANARWGQRQFLQLSDETDLLYAIKALHDAFFSLTGQGNIHGWCWLYGEANTERIYRAEIQWDNEHSEIWVLPDGHLQRARNLESAWQMYLGCWHRALPIIRRDLHEGLALLWQTEYWERARC